MRHQLYLMAAAAITVAAATGASAAERASPASCHQAVNGLVSLLDGKMDNTALYRETFATLVDRCGPATPGAPTPASTSPQPSAERAACDDLASAMTDLIEDDKMNTAEFVKARTAFAQSCAPR